MKKIKKWDTVVVIAGKHKGKIATVDKVVEDMLRLHGVNIVKKAVKWQWFVEKTLPIHVSNVMYYVKDEKKAVRIGFEKDDSGKKKRKAKKLDLIID